MGNSQIYFLQYITHLFKLDFCKSSWIQIILRHDCTSKFKSEHLTNWEVLLVIVRNIPLTLSDRSHTHMKEQQLCTNRPTFHWVMRNYHSEIFWDILKILTNIYFKPDNKRYLQFSLFHPGASESEYSIQFVKKNLYNNQKQLHKTMSIQQLRIHLKKLIHKTGSIPDSQNFGALSESTKWNNAAYNNT